MRSQAIRAAVSVPTNVAERSATKSQKEYKYHLDTSLASAFELETQWLIVEGQSWFPEKTKFNFLTIVSEEQKMLSTFINRIEA